MKDKYTARRTGALLLVLAFLLTSCSKTKTTTEETSGAGPSATSGSSATEASVAGSSGTESSATVSSDGTTSASESDATSPQADPSDTSDPDEIIYTPPLSYQYISIPSTVYCTDEESVAFEQELRKLPGVIDVTREDGYKNGQFLVHYEMPLDHDDPSKGTFTQRMYVYYKGTDAPNLFYCGGYDLFYGLVPTADDVIFTGDDDEEECSFSAKYNCNFFEPEFRFYDPAMENMDYDDTVYWEYLTDENASEDFHFMIEGLKTILTGNWAFEGMSKGGDFTAYQLGRHPEDADLFVMEAAMVNECRDFPGMYEYAYTTAGNDRYGEELGAKYRALLLEFQVELIKHRDGVKPLYLGTADNASWGKMVFSSDFTEDMIYDCAVLDQVYIWQYVFDEYFPALESVLKMKDGTNPGEVQFYEQRLADIMSTYYSTSQFALATESSYAQLADVQRKMYDYFFQEYREDGYYLYDFSYLREALEKDGSGASLVITEDMEEGLFDYRIYEGHRALFEYDPTVCETRVRAVETAEKAVIIVNGTTDVHHVAGISESSNPNVHVFNVIGACHDETDCAYFFTDEQVPYRHPSAEERAEYDTTVITALGI